MIKLSAILLLLISSSIRARELTCLDKLLPYNRYSGLHTLFKTEWYDDKEFLDSESVKLAIAFLTNSKLLCRSSDVVIKVQPVCTTVLPDLAQSNVCFVYTNVGHFILNRDNARNTNIIFSKDKRFSEK